MKKLTALAALLAVFCGACGDTTAPDPIERPASDLHFLRLSTSAPPLQSTVVSFYAKKGEDREVTKAAADFQPSGLKFASSAPARLQFEFGECDRDLNGDGVINATDTALIPQISTWRQEVAGAPWIKVGSIVEMQINEVQADISGFSGYALAY